MEQTNTTITPLAQVIMTYLGTENDWRSMRDIALALGRKRGTPLPYDRLVVRDLVRGGKLEADSRSQGPVKSYAVFRIKAG